MDPRTAGHYPYLDPVEGTEGIGIAVSGGGVRAACLSLGALQVADESGQLARTDYVSAVSGGSYTATAFLASRARRVRQAAQAQQAGDAGDAAGSPPWARGSAEEAHLRRNLRYLGEDWPDIVFGVVRYLVGLLANLAPFVAATALAGVVLGAVLRATGALVADGETLDARLLGARGVCVVAVLLLGAAAEARLPGPRTGRTIRRAAIAVTVALVSPEVIALSGRLLDVDWPAVPPLVAVPALLAVAAVLALRMQPTVTVGLLSQLALRLVRGLLALAMMLAFATPVVYLATLAAQWSAERSARTALGLAAALAVMGAVVRANSTSLHRPYARRLDRAYLVNAQGPVRLSDVHLRDTHVPGLPRLLICTSVNLRDEESAEGEGCASLVFSSDVVGGPTFGMSPADAVPLPCSSLVAASGAAIAPNMGRFTQRCGRAALALLNLRLGVWVDNPALQVPGGVAGQRAGAAPGAARALLSPARRVWSRWVEPGPLAIWREALGDLSREHATVFVSDGGHWDNSGVVELLRRRCRWILAVDAAVDERRVSNLLRALSLARTELGVEMDCDAALLRSTEPVLRIPFSYPFDTPTSPRNYLVVMRTHISDEMPSDLVALGRTHGGFPRHATANQFLEARDVDSYVALGRWLMGRAIDVADLPPPAAVSHHWPPVPPQRPDRAAAAQF